MIRMVEKVQSEDSRPQAAEGRLFARSSKPAAPHSDVPIVLFHDSLGSVALWRGFPEALCAATGRQVIAYDRLGFGESDPYPGTLSPDFVEAEADTGFAAIRRHYGIRRFIAFGHSVGAGMAIHCAARYPDDCVAVITESAQVFVEERTVQGIEAAREAFKEPQQLARLRKYHGDKTEWVLGAWINTWLSPEFAKWSLQEVLPGVTCPVLAIHGAEDEYGSPVHPTLIGQRVSGPARVEIMPDTRHVPHREREAEVAGIVAEFLEGVG